MPESDIHSRGRVRITLDLERTPNEHWGSGETIASTKVDLEVPLRAHGLIESSGDFKRLLADGVDRLLDQGTETLDQQIRLAKEDRRRKEAIAAEDAAAAQPTESTPPF